jgi:ornithine cyclodeaminase
VRVLSGRDVARAIDMAGAIEAVRDAFVQLARGGAAVPVRTPVPVRGQDGVTLFMPAYLSGSGALGCKVVSIRPRNRDRGAPLITALVVLVDEATGSPLAAIEGGYLTALRTGAGSGVATDLLARPDARVLACFGAGAQAATQVEAVCAVRPIERVWVRSRSEETARRFAASVAGRRGIPGDVRVAADPGQALAEADVVCAATTSRTPVFDGRMLRSGTHVNAVGSYTPGMQELDAESVRRARVVVDSRAGCAGEAGDLIVAMGEGAVGGPETWVEVGEIAAGLAPGRRTSDEVTLYKSVGNAAQDVAVGLLALRQAERLGLGQSVDLGDGPA